MTLPRELTLKNGHIYQQPVREVNNYFSKVELDTNTFTKDTNVLENFHENSYRLTFEMDVSNTTGLSGVELFKGNANYTSIKYDKENSLLVFDRNNSGTAFSGVRYAKVQPENNKIKLDIFVDVSSIEVFINDGYYTMSGNVFPNQNDDGIAFVSNGATFSNASYGLFKTN